MPNKRKKTAKKSERREEDRKQKMKVEGAGKLSPKKNCLDILLSAHAQILKAVIWHRERKQV